MRQLEMKLRNPKQKKLLEYAEQRAIEAELLIGKSNQPTYKQWDKEMP